MSWQIIPLKGAQIPGNPAEFRPQRLFGFELRSRQGCLRGRWSLAEVAGRAAISSDPEMIRRTSRLALDVTGQQMDETFLRGSERFSELLARDVAMATHSITSSARACSVSGTVVTRVPSAFFQVV